MPRLKTFRRGTYSQEVDFAHTMFYTTHSEEPLAVEPLVNKRFGKCSHYVAT